MPYIYFLEHDAAGTIHHVCAHPLLTMVPLVNAINRPGLMEPVGITQEQYDSLLGVMNDYTYDATTETLVKKVPHATTAA
jgi:hypothetical protein